MKRQIGILALGAALTFDIVVGAWAQSGGAGGGTGGGAAGTGVTGNSSGGVVGGRGARLMAPRRIRILPARRLFPNLMRHQSRRLRVDEAIRIDRDRYKGGLRRPF
jgi:hypothetical protein